jgi:hypothetical protein
MINKSVVHGSEIPNYSNAWESISMTIYLYKKTHNKTGLQYLGKTTAADPHSYQGSGTYWKNHLKKHGYDVTTEILRECETNEEIKGWGNYYSDLWNVVSDVSWANLKPESGDGGTPSQEMKLKIGNTLRGRKQSHDQIEKRREANRKPRPCMQGRKLTSEHCDAISKGLTGKKKTDTSNMCGPKTELHSKNISLGKRGKKLAVVTCPHCNKTGGRGNMMRYHFDFCKSITATNQV